MRLFLSKESHQGCLCIRSEAETDQAGVQIRRQHGIGRRSRIQEVSFFSCVPKVTNKWPDKLIFHQNTRFFFKVATSQALLCELTENFLQKEERSLTFFTAKINVYYFSNDFFFQFRALYLTKIVFSSVPC